MFSKFLIAAMLIVLFPSEILAQKGSSGSSRSYSSGSTATRSYSSGSRSAPSYSSGKPSSTPAKSYSSGGSSSRPPQPSFDKLARNDKFKADNRAQYERGNSPKNTYTTASGQTKSIDTSSKTVQTTRQNLTEEKWVNRETRIHTTFNNYTVIGASPVIVYHDHFNTFFWLWLLDRSLDERAMWAYHHQSDIDQRRINELRLKDAEFDARLKKLEGTPKNPNYSPPSIDEDLQYTNDYVESVYNPTPKPHNTSWSWFGWFCFWTSIVIVVILVIWLLFFYRNF